jgi:hypothetical protein
VSRRVELEDEDGIDGPFEDAIDRARRADARRAAAYARSMAAYRNKLAAERRTERFAWTGDEVLHISINKPEP